MIRVLVTGASGAIGHRLVPALLESGHTVRCLSRAAARLAPFEWAEDVEIVAGDVGDREALDTAMRRVDAAYYLLHGMDATVAGLVGREEQLAAAFRAAARDRGLSQLIALGGLFPTGELPRLSPHMYARHRAGAILRRGAVPATELRAGIVISPESASFRMLQAAAKLPVIPTPPWMSSRCQPIAIDDVIAYLVGVLGDARANGAVLQIGGPDVLTYREMIRVYLDVTGRWRPMVPVPFGPPELSAPLAAALAGVDVDLALPLLTSSRADAVVTDHRVEELVDLQPMGFDEAVRRALD